VYSVQSVTFSIFFAGDSHLILADLRCIAADLDSVLEEFPK
jgi:hypothetical protein